MSDADEIQRLRDEVDTLTELLADALPKLVERLKLLGDNARLRSLIVYWCDVVDDLDGHPSDYHSNVAAAEDEIRKAVGR